MTALDVARSAVRFGVREVHVVCLEEREEMPATPEEVREAEREGVIFHHGRGVSCILGDEGGRVVGVETLRVASLRDEAGRFAPTLARGPQVALSADSVIFAVGQGIDASFLRPEDGIALTSRGTIEVDPETLETTAPGVFAGGDAAFGPRNVVSAIADGKRAARSIHGFLRLGRARAGEAAPRVRIRRLAAYSREPDYECIPRQHPPLLPLERRLRIAEVEQRFTEEQARREAARCLRCWINVWFDEDRARGTECLLCGGCAEVCPQGCISLVPASRLEVAPELEALVRAEFGEAGRALLDGGGEGTVLLMDARACIRCGLCARRCPAGTIRLEEFLVEQEEGDVTASA